MITAPLKDCTELIFSVSAFYLKVKTRFIRFSLLVGKSNVNNFKLLCCDYILDTFPKPGFLCPSLAQWLLPGFPSQAPVGLQEPYSAALNQRHPEGTTWHQLLWFQSSFFAPPWNADSGLSAAHIEVEFFQGLFPDQSSSFLT